MHTRTVDPEDRFGHERCGQSMLGGKATLAATGVSETVVKGLNGTVLAAIIGFVMVVVARLLPGSLRA